MQTSVGTAFKRLSPARTVLVRAGIFNLAYVGCFPGQSLPKRATSFYQGFENTQTSRLISPRCPTRIGLRMPHFPISSGHWALISTLMANPPLSTRRVLVLHGFHLCSMYTGTGTR